MQLFISWSISEIFFTRLSVIIFISHRNQGDCYEKIKIEVASHIIEKGSSIGAIDPTCSGIDDLLVLFVVILPQASWVFKQALFIEFLKNVVDEDCG